MIGDSIIYLSFRNKSMGCRSAKETLINDILLFGAFNLTSKGSRTAIKEQVSGVNWGKLV